MDPEFDLPAFDRIVQDRFSNVKLFPPHVLSSEHEEPIAPTTTEWTLNPSGRYEARTIRREINPSICVIL
jgi:hypothetical protein